MQSVQAMFLVSLVAAIIEVAYSQSIHVVTVGDSGSFYDPPVTAAAKNDIVIFRWIGTFHSVTQSSFAAPCTPLEGGFDSGVAGNPPQTIGPIPEWNLTITDDTKPIWFFCKMTQPVGHCISGMVGAINAPVSNSNQSFDQFLQNAKALPSQPTGPSGVAALGGIGAMATATPVRINATQAAANASSSSTSSTSSTTASSNSSVTPAATQSQASSNSGGLSGGAKGGIAGGIVAGVIVLILLALLFMSYRRGRRYRKEAAANKTLRSLSSRDMSHVGGQDLLYNGAHHESTPQVAGHFHRSQGSPSVADSTEHESTAGPSINIKELAAEIAKNIRQESGVPERNRLPQETGGLAAVPEQLVADAVSRAEAAREAESIRGAESARRVDSVRGAESTRNRQLPRPPPTNPKRADDTMSVDTLPAYVSGQAR